MELCSPGPGRPLSEYRPRARKQKLATAERAPDTVDAVYTLLAPRSGTASDFPQAVDPLPMSVIPGGYSPGQIRVMAHFKEEVRGTVEVQPLLV